MLAAVCWIASHCVAHAGPREDSLAAISRCRSVPDDRQFLDCLYGAVQPLRAELGLAPAPEFQLALVPPDPRASVSASASSGGAGVVGAIGNASAVSSSLRLASYSFDPRGHFTVTLSDGSKWRQLDRDQSFADWRGPADRYYVSLRSSGNDHYLDVKGGNGPFQVEQTR